MIAKNGVPNISTDKVVLFPFDDYSIPFRHGVRLQLVGYKSKDSSLDYSLLSGIDRKKIVLRPGSPGAPDSKLVFTSAVRRVGGELWMWYLGQGNDRKLHLRVCFCKSKDGYSWERPNLGLVEYEGNANNNLVDLMGDKHHVNTCVVFYDPDDSDRKRKFKMAFQSSKYNDKLAVAYSEDGLRWEESSQNPVGPWFEMGGSSKFNGCYYLTGQGKGSYFSQSRKLLIHISYDFEHWTQSSCLGLRRDNLPPRPMTYDFHAGEQVHLGAALWNRGNVIIGFYGQWHGHPSNDRRLLTMDLGLVVSNDALHYREPIPDFRIVPAAEDSWRQVPFGDTTVHFPALRQGQGFENIGDETLFWYAPWPEQDCDGVRVASWTRDRLGYFQSFLGPEQNSHFISAPLDLESKPARIYMNIDGLSEYSKVTVNILDEQLRKIPGYSRAECIAPQESGLRQLVRWKNQKVVEEVEGPMRIRVNFEGVRPEDLKLYAVYIEHTS